MRRALQCTRAFSNLFWPSLYRPTPPSLPTFALSWLPQRAWNSESIRLRDYQEDCVRAILTSMNEGERRMAISLATGGGKTVIFTELISRLTHPARPEAEKTLILVHRRELVQQAAKQCERQYPEKVIAIEMGTSHANVGADIIVASVQSIINRLEKYDAELYKLLLIDECHHAVSPSYLKVLTHFQAMDVNERTPIVVGVSATVSRFDGVSLGKVMDKLVFHMDSTTMIENEWLSPPRFTTVSSSVDLEGVKEGRNGDFDINGLGRAVNTDTANDIIIQTWKDRASERKSTLVFCVNIAHVRSVMDTFRKNGIDAREVTSRSSIQTRRECLEEFKAGKFPVMVNCGVFTEGTDIPNIDCVILARPTRSKNLITQMIGRGLRKSEGTGKTDCHIIDMVANLSRGIATAPTLFGLDPDMLVTEMTPDEMRAIAAKQAEARQKTEEKEKRLLLAVTPPPPPIQLEYTDYDNIWELLSDSRADQVIYTISKLAWVSIYPGKYVLSCARNGYIMVERDHSGWYKVEEFRALPPVMGLRGWARPKLVMSGIEQLDAVIRGADTYILSVYPRKLVARSSGWRKLPATDQQLEFLKKYRHDKDWEDMRKAGTLTKGKVGDIITRVKHGTVRRFEEGRKERRKKERAEAKERKRSRREEVKLGSLE
ncbi:P-loop containing nucleoside triphosphate hydrolase protein [Tuber indicum]|nr:P-loop containing nucleoside triphosphate hydrolase protein [Tuber indicum]